MPANLRSIALLTGLFCLSAQAAPIPAATATDTAKLAAVQQKLGGMRLPFVENRGQIDESVAYYAKTLSGTVFVTRSGEIVYALPSKEEDSPKTQVLTERLMSGKTVLAPVDTATTKVSHFVGNDKSKWQSNLTTHGAVSLGEAWKGIEVELRAHGKNVEKFFTVKPGAKAETIQMQLEGAKALRVATTGELEMATDSGTLRFSPPVAWQEENGQKHPVEVTYVPQGNQYSFKLGQYDNTKPVIIDPLLQSTYLGGSGNDGALSMSIHPVNGDIYLFGSTDSIDFPGVSGGVQEGFAGNQGDIFVARLDKSLTFLSQATYLGGSGIDSGADAGTYIATHPQTGDVYVLGHTNSPQFPGTSGGAQASRRGAYDLVIAKLNDSLTTLIQSTYLGGSGVDYAGAIAIHPQTFDVYVASYTYSTNFPRASGGAQSTLGGGQDMVVARLDSSLKTLFQSTYLGGAAYDWPYSLVIGPDTGEVYVAGYTDSSNFPGTIGGAQVALGGNTDIVIARLNKELTSLLQSTYLGGASWDYAQSILVHPQTGELYVAGLTYSSDFPGTAGGAQPSIGSAPYQVVIAQLAPSLNNLIQATYLGGNIYGSHAEAIFTHPQTGEIYICGYTNTSDFPGTFGGAQATLGGYVDISISRLDSALKTLNQSTYLGGLDADYGSTCALHPQTGEVFVAGYTYSTNFPSVNGGAQSYLAAYQDVVAARLTPSLSEAEQYNLVASRTGGEGIIISTDGRINCDVNGMDCIEPYTYGTTVTLNATPSANSTFSGWTGACSGTSNTCTLTIYAYSQVFAGFNYINYELSVTKAGAGTGTVTAPSLICGTTCSISYVSGTSITLYATPDQNMVFAGWGGACSGAANTCTITMDEAKSVTATFEKATFNLTVSKIGAGTGTVSGTGINCGIDCNETFTAGTVVALTAKADTNSKFSGWSGACAGVRTTTCNVTMDATKDASAKFNLIPQ